LNPSPKRVANRFLDRLEDRQWVKSLPKGLKLYRQVRLLLNVDEIVLNGLPREWTLDKTLAHGMKDRRSRDKTVTVAILAVKQDLDAEETVKLAERHPGKMMVSLNPRARVFVEGYYDRGEFLSVRKWGKIG